MRPLRPELFGPFEKTATEDEMHLTWHIHRAANPGFRRHAEIRARCAALRREVINPMFEA
jgi:hypothetical protein